MISSFLSYFKKSTQTQPAEMKEEYRIINQKIHVHTGKLVVANSFSLLFGRKDEQEELDYLIAHKGSETKVRIDYWSTKGIAYIPTSSTLPDLFLKTSRDSMEIRYNIAPDSQYYDDYPKTTDFHYPVLDTGLWAVCAMDLELLKHYADKRFNFDFNHDFNELSATIIDVVPGYYELAVLSNWPKKDEELLTYGKLKRIE